MRLTIVRQDYRPEGPVERVTERALEALLELSAARRLYRNSRDRFHPFLQLVPPADLEGVNPDRFRGDAIAVGLSHAAPLVTCSYVC